MPARATLILALLLAAATPVRAQVELPGATGGLPASALAPAARAAALPRLHYVVAAPQPTTHLVEMGLAVEDVTGETLDLILPSWTPGSYKIRDYARHVEGFEAVDDRGRALSWRKQAKDHWRITGAGARRIAVRYRVWANERSVRTSELDDRHGTLIPASLFMAVAGRETEPLTLRIDAPPGWTVATLLARDPAGAGRFVAPHYDALIDSPIEIGPLRRYPFAVQGVPHEFVFTGDEGEAGARLVADTTKIIEAAAALFGGLPYQRYVFLVFVAPGAGGGLEHRDGCSLQAGPDSFDGEGYRRFLELVAHEFFHAWLVKRLRPDTLDRFDYRRENHSRDLWFLEGATSYSEGLLLLAAGLIDLDAFLALQTREIEALETVPGRLEQPLSEASFDAWTKYYQPSEHSRNATVSYYGKGHLVSLLLDLELRARSHGALGLDAVFRDLWHRYGREDRPYPEERGIRDAAARAAGAPRDDFFARYVDGTDELPLEAALAGVGLRLTRQFPREKDADGAEREVRERASLDAQLRPGGAGLRVVHLDRDGAAWRAGLMLGDEIVAIDERRADEAALRAALDRARPGAELRLTLFRGARLVTAAVPLAARSAHTWKAQADPQASRAARAAFRAWTGRPFPAPKDAPPPPADEEF